MRQFQRLPSLVVDESWTRMDLSEPDHVTSVNDDSVGGDTGTGSPAPSDWGGLWLSGAGSADLEHAA